MTSFVEMMAKSRNDPAWFVETVFGTSPCRKDSVIYHTLVRDPIVSVSKTKEMLKLSVYLAFWFLYSFENAKVVVVSPNQLATLLWFEELHKAYWEASYDFGGELRADHFIISPESFVLGVTPDTHDLEQLLGFVSPNSLFILNGSTELLVEAQAVNMTLACCENGKLLSLGKFDPRDLYAKS